MAITRLGTASGSATPAVGNGYVWSLDVSALGLASGDVIVLELSVGTNNVDLPDFTLSGNASGSLGNPEVNRYANDVHDSNTLVWVKELTGADTTLTVTASATYDGLTGAMICKGYRNCDATFLDVAIQSGNSASASRCNPGPITTVTDKAMVVACYAHANGSGAAYTAPGDTDNFVQHTAGASAPFSHAAMGDKVVTPAGTFDPAQILGGTVGSDDSSSWATIALRPGDVAAGGKFKVRLSGSDVEKPVKVRLGGAWVEKPLKVRKDGAWVLA